MSSDDLKQCQNQNGVLSPTGKCDSCPPFQTVVNNKCVNLDCEANYRILFGKGKCEKCPDYHSVTKDRMSCNRKTCLPIQKQLKNGQCEDCKEFTKVHSNGIECIREQCPNNHVISKWGTCKPCGEYEISIPEKNKCVIHPTCYDRENLRKII